MEKNITLGIIVAALLVISAIGLVAISYNADDNDDNNGKKISAADLMPDIEVFPDGWERVAGFIGPHAILDELEGVLFLQATYKLGDTGPMLTVSIAVCDTAEDAEAAFAFSEANNTSATNYVNGFDQCFTYDWSTYVFFVFQHENIYGILQFNFASALTAGDFDNIMEDIFEKILTALA